MKRARRPEHTMKEIIEMDFIMNNISSTLEEYT